MFFFTDKKVLLCKFKSLEISLFNKSTEQQPYILGLTNIATNLYCICLSDRQTFAYPDAVHVCGNK